MCDLVLVIIPLVQRYMVQEQAYRAHSGNDTIHLITSQWINNFFPKWDNVCGSHVCIGSALPVPDPHAPRHA